MTTETLGPSRAFLERYGVEPTPLHIDMVVKDLFSAMTEFSSARFEMKKVGSRSSILATDVMNIAYAYDHIRLAAAFLYVKDRPSYSGANYPVFPVNPAFFPRGKKI